MDDGLRGRRQRDLRHVRAASGHWPEQRPEGREGLSHVAADDNPALSGNTSPTRPPDPASPRRPSLTKPPERLPDRDQRLPEAQKPLEPDLGIRKQLLHLG